MSDGHDHDHLDDDSDSHDEHAFDGEPARELAPGEPLTPGWVPLVGAAVFVLGAVFLVTQREAAPPGSGASPDTPSTQAAAPPTPPPLPRMPPPTRPSAPDQAQPARPGGSALPNVRRLTPDQIKDLQQRIQDARKNQDAGGQK